MLPRFVIFILLLFLIHLFIYFLFLKYFSKFLAQVSCRRSDAKIVTSFQETQKRKLGVYLIFITLPEPKLVIF